MTNVLPFSAPPPKLEAAPPYPTNLRPVLMCGWLVIAAVFGGFGTWAAFAPLSRAAIAPGIVVVDTNRKSVQHLEGGVIREILSLCRFCSILVWSFPRLRFDAFAIWNSFYSALITSKVYPLLCSAFRSTLRWQSS
jgi:hypothetical protein